MTCLAFMSLGFTEMLVIGLVALLMFGGRLPEVMQSLGKNYAKFRRGMSDLTNPIRQEMRNLDVTSPPPPPPAPRSDDTGGTSPPPPLYTPSKDSVPREAEQKIRPAPSPSVPPPEGGAGDEPPPV